MKAFQSSLILFITLIIFGCQQDITIPLALEIDPESPFSIIKFDVPAEYQSHFGSPIYVTNDQQSTPAQWLDAQTVTFVWSANAENEGALKLKIGASENTAVTFASNLNTDQLSINGPANKVLTYQIEEVCPDGAPAYYCRSGFIHPLYSPDGKVITDDFPVGHTHQHALFYAWVNNTYKGEFMDFWNQQKETGTIAFDTIDQVFAGPVAAGFTSKQDHLNLTHGKVLDETWKVITYQTSDYNILDLEVFQENTSSDTLYVNQYHYGGLGIRGSKYWNDADTINFKSAAQFLTSEGKTREDGNHTSPKWSTLYGDIEGQNAGVVVFDHPTNLRHPQPVRIHPNMPYFCLAPMVNAPIILAPGDTYEAKFRILTFDGDPDSAELDQLWEDYGGM